MDMIESAIHFQNLIQAIKFHLITILILILN